VGKAGEIVVRPARIADIESLCSLYAEFHEFHLRGLPERLTTMGGSGADRRARLHARLREIISVHDSVIFVAERGGHQIGLAEVYLRHDEPGRGLIPRRFGHLQSMVVREEDRRAGVGAALLEASEAWARAGGASEMRLDIWEFPEGPLLFYERCGYRTLRRTLVRRLV
jgi:GNAT superfamily N-acetyltransferase